MGYVGGYGGGRGWHKYRFLLLPEELQAILSEHHPCLFKDTYNIPATSDFQCLPVENYVLQYEKYFRSLLGEGEPLGMWVYESVDMHLTSSVSLLRFAPSVLDPKWKEVIPIEPLINLSPSSIFYETHGRIVLGLGGMEHYSFGIEMSFPKVVSYGDEGHEFLHETGHCQNYALFNDLKASIKSKTTGVKIKSLMNEHRIDVHISPAVREIINRHPGLKAQGLIVL
ncbi:MAG: hypothetical protein ACYC6A_12410 [Armatimonadota bacterium]